MRQSMTIGLGTLALAAAMALGAACSDDTNSGTDDDGNGGNGATGNNGGNGGTGNDGGGGTSGGGPVCEAPQPAHAGEVDGVDSITAHYVDLLGNDAEGVQTTVCGTNICSEPVDSAMDGTVTVDASGIDSFNDPRFNVSQNALMFAKLSALIPTKPTHDFGQVRVIPMAEASAGVPINAGQEATHGGVTLNVPAGASVEHDEIDVPEPYRVLRGAVVDITEFPASEFPSVPAGLGIEVLVVAMPLGTHICPAAELRFDNVNNWAAGTMVDIYINGAKTFDHYAPYGEWAIIAEAEVSADGLEVVTTADSGVELLGTFGAAPKP
jgi:hypothetical protein